MLCLDWTAWGEPFSVLTASVCVEKRSIPVAVSAVKKSLLARSQNLWEETFLRLCVERLQRAWVKAIWLCDRGFHRVAWLLALKNLKQQFVVRLQRDVLVEIDERKVLLKSLRLNRGEFRDFGWVKLRVDGAVKVRLIGIWAIESKEIWWLATNLNSKVSEIVGLYDRPMSVEEQFRDTKGARLSLVRIGMLFWRSFTKRLKLTTKFVKRNLPRPKVRIFPWLQVQQN